MQTLREGEEMKLSMGIALALVSTFGAKDFSQINKCLEMSFTGNYPKKQNKLSQSAKRKRARKKGGKK